MRRAIMQRLAQCGQKASEGAMDLNDPFRRPIGRPPKTLAGFPMQAANIGQSGGDIEQGCGRRLRRRAPGCPPAVVPNVLGAFGDATDRGTDRDRLALFATAGES
jgi:hypothetical protein